MPQRKKKKITDYYPEITSIWSFDDLDNDPQIKEWQEEIDQGTIYYE